MKLPHKQSNLHCLHKQTKLQGKAAAYKRTRESNNEDGRLCFRLWHNLSLEHKLLKPKPGSMIFPQMENIPWWFPQGRKHEQTLEIVAPMRSAPLLPQANSPNPHVTTTNGSARERGSKETRYSKFENFPPAPGIWQHSHRTNHSGYFWTLSNGSY